MVAMRERTDEAYKKINQLEAQKYSRIGINSQLNKELRSLALQVARFEESKAAQESIAQVRQRKRSFQSPEMKWENRTGDGILLKGAQPNAKIK